MRDPYTVLGVTKSANEDDIKQAYRQLAKKVHPDLNPGRADIEQRFKEVSAAYDLLSNPERRAQYDSGLIGPDGSPKAQGFGRGFSGFDFRTGQAAGRAARRSAEAEDVFDQNFGMFGQGTRRKPFGSYAGGGRAWSGSSGFTDKPEKPAPQKVHTDIPFELAVKGGTHRVILPSGRAVNVRIPVGTEDGARLRLPEQGQIGSDRTRGDVLVTVAVTPEPPLERDGQDIVCTVDVNLDQAVLGGQIAVPTVEGSVTMKVPAGSNAGTRLRLRGRGVPAHGNKLAGDQYVTLRIKLDDPADRDLVRYLLARRDATAAAANPD